MILLAQRNLVVRQMAENALRAFDFEIDLHVARHLTKVRRLVKVYSYDLIILGSDFNDGDVLNFCERVTKMRVLDEQTPILLLIRRSYMQQFMQAQSGIPSDYLMTPFTKEEFKWRVRRLLPNINNAATNKLNITFGQLKLDCSDEVLFMNHQKVALTPIETTVMCLLMKTGTTCSCKKISKYIYTRHNRHPTAPAIRTIISRLRKKFLKTFGMQLLYSRYKHGYWIKTV